MAVIQTSRPHHGSNAKAKPGASRRQELGQFLTPVAIADFMSSIVEPRTKEIRLLDPGAGAGTLTAAFIKRLCAQADKPLRVDVSAYEVDKAILTSLGRTLEECRNECAAAGIDFSATILNEDFIEAALPLIRSELFGVATRPFNITILNPPYRKISSESKTRKLLREAGIETSNLYTGFVALASMLLCDDGQLVAICPRSFCNGPYFKPFRAEFLRTMSLRRPK